MRKKTNGSLKLYRAYNFRDKDPVIDELRTLAEDHFGGRINHKFLHQIEIDGGPTSSCMAGWFMGATKRPQSATLEAAGRAIGFRRVWQKLPKDK
jgi:hypothetical protein